MIMTPQMYLYFCICMHERCICTYTVLEITFFDAYHIMNAKRAVSGVISIL